ncbi:hypothetical protein ACWEKT_02640 [Nocardia takedensis]
MSAIKIECSFPEAEVSVADRLCTELDIWLKDAGLDVVLSRVRSDPLTQDAGATLLIALSSPAVIIVSRELSKWVTRRYGTKLRLRRKLDGGEVREVDITGPINTRTQNILREFFGE